MIDVLRRKEKRRIAMEKIKELEEISRPIINFLKENYHLHATVIINEDCIKVVSDEIVIPFNIDLKGE